jgi:hypothetical protein
VSGCDVQISVDENCDIVATLEDATIEALVDDASIEIEITQGIPGPPGVTIPGLAVTTINGQPTLTLVDTTRGNKILSVAEQPFPYSENRLTNNDWVRPGHANDALSGYQMDFDGTIVSCTAQCEDTGANSKDIHLYIDAVDQGSVGTLTGGANVGFQNTTLDLDFSQGARIRARAVGVDGAIQDTVVKVTVKWRG